MINEIELTEFEKQNMQSQDKIKSAISNLKKGLNELGINEDKLAMYLNELNDFEELYTSRLVKWKIIIEAQKKSHKNKLETLPENIAKKESNQKEQYKKKNLLF
jgi:hypothetical protein